MTQIEKLQAIYNAEEHLTLKWFWDGGIEVRLGWIMHENPRATFTQAFEQGRPRSTRCFDTVAEAIDWAYEQVCGEKICG